MERISIESRAATEWIDVTDRVAQAVAGLGTEPRAVLLFCPHTTAALTINEGFDPAVADDVQRALEAQVPRISFRHAEGNSPAHLLASLVGTSVVVPVEAKRLQLGRWQRIFFCEFDGPRHREVWVQPLA
ncbi:MAG TPA: secondary thiamine-phosphate synthase enzyme YjbQ [Limnochorda sp.]